MASSRPHDVDEGDNHLQHSSEQLPVVSGLNAHTPLLSSAVSSSSSRPLRKVPPVPKFTADNPSMGPKSISTSSRGLMRPPPVPQFRSSAMGPPKAPPSPHHSYVGHSESMNEPLSEEENSKVGELPIAGGGDVATALASRQRNGVSEVERSGMFSLAEEGNKKELDSARATSGTNSGQPPYSIPSWSAVPGYPYTMEILKEGNILGVEDVSKKGAYMFGRSDRCDFVLEHPTVSRYHAVLQYNSGVGSFLYDLGSTHGTFINKVQVKGREYVPLHVGDIVRFGFSSRLHVFQGPLELMPEEGLTQSERRAQKLVEGAQDRAIREASMTRGKLDSMASDGVSWGMQEDAEEEAVENVEEVTWQTFKGELTEKQQKTLAKIHKYNEKLSNLRKENDAIQAKELSQGGLTQGQQTQVARNEQRMEQLAEEVENLEETVNESIQESISGRAGLKRRGKKNASDEEEDDLSDEDEFYDRASKGQPRKKKDSVQKVETADSLLDQKAALTTEIENLRDAITAEEKSLNLSQEEAVTKMDVETADPLDQFMTHLSSTIVKDKTSHLQRELDSLNKELARVERLYKIADPTGESLKKWRMKKNVEGNQETEILKKDIKRMFPRMDGAQDRATADAGVKNKSEQTDLQPEITVDAGEPNSDSNADETSPSEEDTTVLPGLEPPLRLGAPLPEVSEELKPEVSDTVHREAGNFVTYKQRKKGIDSGREPQLSVAQVVAKYEGQNSTEKREDVSTADLHVADSVALLLRQKRGLVAEDSDVFQPTQHTNCDAGIEDKQRSRKQSKKRKKPIPANMTHTTDMETAEDWVPPAGQTGDGRTALNDKYGY